MNGHIGKSVMPEAQLRHQCEPGPKSTLVRRIVIMLKSVVRVKNSTISNFRLASIKTKTTMLVGGFVIGMDFLEHLISVAALALVVWLVYVDFVNRMLPLVGI